MIQVLRDNVSNPYFLGYSPVSDESGVAGLKPGVPRGRARFTRVGGTTLPLPRGCG